MQTVLVFYEFVGSGMISVSQLPNLIYGTTPTKQTLAAVVIDFSSLASGVLFITQHFFAQHLTKAFKIVTMVGT